MTSHARLAPSALGRLSFTMKRLQGYGRVTHFGEPLSKHLRDESHHDQLSAVSCSWHNAISTTNTLHPPYCFWVGGSEGEKRRGEVEKNNF